MWVDHVVCGWIIWYVGGSSGIWVDHVVWGYIIGEWIIWYVSRSSGMSVCGWIIWYEGGMVDHLVCFEQSGLRSHIVSA